jgi:hypothetical protein
MFANTTAFAGGVGSAPDGVAGVVVGVVGVLGLDGVAGVGVGLGAGVGVDGVVVGVVGAATVAVALCECNPLPQPPANNNVRELSKR